MVNNFRDQRKSNKRGPCNVIATKSLPFPYYLQKFAISKNVVYLWLWTTMLLVGGYKKSKLFSHTVTRVGTIWPFSSNLTDPTWNWRINLLWAPKSTKKSYLTMGTPGAMATCCWAPANLRIFWSFSKYVILYTNRCEISCWFQKCIALYVYLANFMSYVQKRAFFGPDP